MEITTTIPADHTVTVNCGAGGKVTVGDTDYTDSHDFTVTRHGSFTMTALAGHGYKLDSITSDSSSGLTLGASSATLDRVCGDVSITVTFKSSTTPGPGPDPDPDPDPDPVPDPIPDPVPDPIPDPVPDPIPDPIPDPVPDPIPDPIPDPVPDPIPDPVPDPILDPTLDPIPDPEPISLVVPVIGEEESITAEAVVIGESVEIELDEERLTELLTVDSAAETVTVDVSGIEADINTVVIPSSAIQTVAERAESGETGITGMVVAMPRTTVTFDTAALASIARQAEEDTVTLYVEKVGTEGLNPMQQAALEEIPENAVLVEVTLRSGNTVISDFGGGSAEVRLPYTPQAGEDVDTISVWHVAQDGTLEEIPCRYGDGYVFFTVRHFSNYLIKPGTIASGEQPPLPQQPDGGDEGSHCLVCGWLGRNIAPWCWLTPLVIAAALGTALFLRKRRGQNA